MKRKCYFVNAGVIFDNTNKQRLKDCWNCNPNCCKSDLCNGLWCEMYGIEFNKKTAEDELKSYVIQGCENSYAYYKEIEIDLEDDLWKDIESYLINDYNFTENEIKERGFIPFDFSEIIEENSSYWEQPDVSYLKQNNKILKDVITIKKQDQLNSEIMNWINKELYNEQTNEIQM